MTMQESDEHFSGIFYTSVTFMSLTKVTNFLTSLVTCSSHVLFYPHHGTPLLTFKNTHNLITSIYTSQTVYFLFVNVKK